MERSGGCECGAVRYRSAGPWREIIACHCQQCRRTSGHFWAATAVPAEALVLDEDRGLTWFRSSGVASRGFCAGCGASLFYRHDDKSYVAIGAGTLDDDVGLRLTQEVYVEAKGGYYALSAGVPHCAGFDGNWQAENGA